MEQELLNIVAANVVRFRKVDGLSQSSLAAASGLSIDSVKRIESAFDSVSDDEIVAVARALKRSIIDLITELPTLEHIRFRAHNATTPETREVIVGSCVKWIDDYCFIENLLDVPTNFVTFPPIGKERNIPEYAGIIRQQLNIDNSSPIFDVADVLDSCNIKTLYSKFPQPKGVFGLAIKESPRKTGVVVFVNGITTERIIFTTIHELAHILLHADSFCSANSEENKTEEKEADVFASHFLMPREAFLKRWNECVSSSFAERVIKVKRHFRVSYKTVILRLIDEGLADNKAYVKFNVQYRRITGKDLKGHKEACPLSPLDKPQGRFESLVCRAVTQGEITVSRAAEIMNITTPQAYDLIASAGGEIA